MISNPEKTASFLRGPCEMQSDILEQTQIPFEALVSLHLSSPHMTFKAINVPIKKRKIAKGS
jgi:hypothetical protein